MGVTLSHAVQNSTWVHLYGHESQGLVLPVKFLRHILSICFFIRAYLIYWSNHWFIAFPSKFGHGFTMQFSRASRIYIIAANPQNKWKLTFVNLLQCLATCFRLYPTKYFLLQADSNVENCWHGSWITQASVSKRVHMSTSTGITSWTFWISEKT